MKLQQIFGTATTPRALRSRLEQRDFFSAETAQHELRRVFPHHVICRERDGIAVKVKDKSFSIAVFKEIP